MIKRAIATFGILALCVTLMAAAGPIVATGQLLAYQDGYVMRPTAPGLGITVNEDVVREMAKTGHRWRNPVWRTPDGVVTEW